MNFIKLVLKKIKTIIPIKFYENLLPYSLNFYHFNKLNNVRIFIKREDLWHYAIDKTEQNFIIIWYIEDNYKKIFIAKNQSLRLLQIHLLLPKNGITCGIKKNIDDKRVKLKENFRISS